MGEARRRSSRIGSAQLQASSHGSLPRKEKSPSWSRRTARHPTFSPSRAVLSTPICSYTAPRVWSPLDAEAPGPDVPLTLPVLPPCPRSETHTRTGIVVAHIPSKGTRILTQRSLTTAQVDTPATRSISTILQNGSRGDSPWVQYWLLWGNPYGPDHVGREGRDQKAVPVYLARMHELLRQERTPQSAQTEP